MHIVLITGASWVLLGIRYIEELLKADQKIVVVISETALKILYSEAEMSGNPLESVTDYFKRKKKQTKLTNFIEYKNTDFFCSIASGSTFFQSVTVIPCSMKTLSGIANGYTNTLIERTVDVCLKEDRKCLLVPRETPVSIIHLENMLKAARAGCKIVLPIPAFYSLPKTIDDIVNFILGKLFNLLSIEHQLFKSWGDNNK